MDYVFTETTLAGRREGTQSEGYLAAELSVQRIKAFLPISAFDIRTGSFIFLKNIFEGLLASPDEDP